MKSKSVSKKIVKTVGEVLLELIQNMGELMIDIAFTPYGKLSISNMYVPKPTFYSTLMRLEKRGLIKKKKRGYKNVYTITEEGKSLIRKPKYTSRRSDGFSTVIIFDVPEEKARQRTILRRYLVRNDYTMLQKSVFISPYKVSEDLKLLIRELNLSSNTSILSAKVEYVL